VYNLGIYIYKIAAAIASIFSKKIRTMLRGQQQTFGILREKIKPEDYVVWFHCASLGEFEQGRPIMERVRKNHPEYKILLSFFSPSGYEVRKDYPGADAICYLPFDTKHNARKFVRLAHPKIAVFIKYEFWTNYLTRLHSKGVKLYSVSSIFRPTQHFFRWFSSPYILKKFDHFFVQNQQSKDLLHTIGIDCVTVTGDTRFDRVLDIRNAARPLPLVEQFAKGHNVFICGSSWEPDEEIYIPYMQQHLDWRLIIAPHVVSESHIASIERLLQGRKIVRYSHLGEEPDADVLIIDCFGLLSSIYRYAQVAYVGGGFGAGIHNVPEAAVYGIPVIFGPNNQKFREAQKLKECGAGFEITDAETFAKVMQPFIDNPASAKTIGQKAADYITQNAGAADTCYKAIFEQA